jgi:predicted small lipoprotein YifL
MRVLLQLLAIAVLATAIVACGNKGGLKSPEQMATEQARQARRDAKDAQAAQATPTPTPTPTPSPEPQ